MAEREIEKQLDLLCMNAWHGSISISKAMSQKILKKKKNKEEKWKKK